MNPSEMTDEQLNVAIAEACGWKRMEDNPSVCPIHGCQERHFWWTLHGVDKGTAHEDESPIPNFVTSLDAMATAEATRRDFQRANTMTPSQLPPIKTCQERKDGLHQWQPRQDLEKYLFVCEACNKYGKLDIQKKQIVSVD